MGYYSEKVLRQLDEAREKAETQYRDLVVGYSSFKFSSEKAREYATHGFGRRLKIVRRCIANVFRILPPDRDDVPRMDDIEDATINIQAFVFNLFGALDNLAWVWVFEKNVTRPNGNFLDKREVGLGPDKKAVRNSFSTDFQDALATFDDWFEAMVIFRDALAHRIPLYIPPYAVPNDKMAAFEELNNKMVEALKALDFAGHDQLLIEQARLGKFLPWIQHSFAEGANPVMFHPQMLSDFQGLTELGLKLLEELNRVAPRA